MVNGTRINDQGLRIEAFILLFTSTQFTSKMLQQENLSLVVAIHSSCLKSGGGGSSKKRRQIRGLESTKPDFLVINHASNFRLQDTTQTYFVLRQISPHCPTQIPATTDHSLNIVKTNCRVLTNSSHSAVKSTQIIKEDTIFLSKRKSSFSLF